MDFKFLDEEEIFLRRCGLSYSAYITDPFRCDFCESGCSCDEEYLKEMMKKVVEEFPRLIGKENKVEDYITEWAR